MKNRKPFLLLFLIAPVLSFAWGAEGHKMIALIAYQFLDKSVKDSVSKYLDGISIEDASVWMDEIKGDHSYDYMKPMHYVNVRNGERYSANTDVNIINGLNDVMKRLRSHMGTKEEKETDLKILLHLIGDLHQPLHCGYAEDKGGNTVQVTFFGRGTNLHRLWDSEMIQKSGITKEDCLKLLSKHSKSEIEGIEKTDVIKWMEESRSYLPVVYGFTDNRLGQAYMDKNIPVVEKQLLFSGIRLAGILNQILGK